MGQVLLVLVIALTVAAVVFGVTVLISGRDALASAEPDGTAVPLPGSRPLRESDVGAVRFDTGLRGYRMAQVDQAMRRAAYDIGYKAELIGVLEAEVAALREGRTEDADALRRTREEAAGAASAATPDGSPVAPDADGSGPADTDLTPAEPVGTVRPAVTEPAGHPTGPAPLTGTGSGPTGTVSAPTDGTAGAPTDGTAEARTDDPTEADQEGGRPGNAVVRSESV
ncbi:DivIVA domain-containing protein [Micromonospora sp. NPDC092111]|uniref:DivIVA domain-containing protein n=1 Tax=Micromonospora sp. NPDC092111 TaxID=3364289 RepID=UPI0037F55D1F